MEAMASAAGEAVRMWREDLSPIRVDLSDTTRAALINNRFYGQVRRELAEDDGFRFDQLKNQRFLLFDDSILVRFKLFDSFLTTRNYPTAQAMDFVAQEYIEGMPPLARLHFGYRLDAVGLRVREAFVTLPTGTLEQFNDWIWQIAGEPISTYGVAQRLPLDGESASPFYAYDDY
jgi:hypothetical protein